ncbi:cupin domain-containing protein [Brevibacillus sp. H7]|uniref:cupin domain-containing protein n=1 Tax=Brevibacillus sp. H7 TaxID=3349138 RepID=UPI003827239F
MKWFRFDASVSRTIDKFDSVHASISKVLRITQAEHLHIGCIHLGPNGILGHHPAPVPQLFLVVQGEGWVRGEGEERVRIEAGQAVFWETGEGHESGTESGMTAIVIEGDQLDPSQYMPAL